jgi:hypothetical protein
MSYYVSAVTGPSLLYKKPVKTQIKHKTPLAKGFMQTFVVFSDLRQRKHSHILYIANLNKKVKFLWIIIFTPTYDFGADKTASINSGNSIVPISPIV